jgi:hypothetical protein
MYVPLCVVGTIVMSGGRPEENPAIQIDWKVRITCTTT